MFAISPSFLATLLVTSMALSVHAALGPITELNVANKVISPDGFSRSAALVNGAFPGPLITNFKYGQFIINVNNRLTDRTMLRSTSIHWHGLLQKGTNWADGPSFVNQCPITANHTFQYQFSAADQAGSFWYHSHLSTQYCDGIRGPLVVYDLLDPHRSLYDIDNENTVITLADWYHLPAPSAGPFPTFSSTLINGLGRYNGGPASPLSVVSVVRGLRYRMRLISLSCDPNFVFSIDGHTMTLIEVDGVNIVPKVVDSVQIFAAQRYSFVLTANQPIGNYWIRANPNFGNTGFVGGINSAILRYVGAPTQEPTTAQTTSVMPMKEWDLAPLKNAAAPGKPYDGGADIHINLDLAFDFGILKFSVNGVTFEPPAVPVLLQILSGAKTAQELIPESTITLPPNKVIELSIPGGVIGGGHPFHLHGHTFSVIRSAGNNTLNYINPVQRDVVNIGGEGDNVTIRWTTDNPGPWFLHCHIDWHLEAGLAVVFAEDVPDAAKANVPQQWSELCPIYDAQTPDQLAVDRVGLTSTTTSSATTTSAASTTTTASATIISSTAPSSPAAPATSSSARPASASTSASLKSATSTTNKYTRPTGGIAFTIPSEKQWLDGLLGNWLSGHRQRSRHGRDFSAR